MNTMQQLEVLSAFNKRGAEIMNTRAALRNDASELEKKAQELDKEVHDFLNVEFGLNGNVNIVEVLKKVLEESCGPKLIMP